MSDKLDKFIPSAGELDISAMLSFCCRRVQHRSNERLGTNLAALLIVRTISQLFQWRCEHRLQAQKELQALQ